MIATNPDPTFYQAQLEDKLQQIRRQFSYFSLPEIETFPSTPLHFRHRAEFAVWHDGDDIYYAVFPKGRGHPPHYLQDFPIASQTINRLMAELMPLLKNNFALKQKLFQVSFHSTLADDAVVVLTYHKPLDQAWHAQAEALHAQLGVNLIGRSRKQKEIFGHDYVCEKFTVAERQLRYRQPEGCFTQSNASICQAMLNWVDNVLTNTVQTDSDLLELYCGNGNFTLAMATHFRKVLATEIVKQLVSVAQQNCRDNQIDNIDVVRLAARDVVDAINKVRPFRRLHHIDLDNYHFSTLFVDPPRCGLDATCHQLAKGFEQIVYISCNPPEVLDS